MYDRAHAPGFHDLLVGMLRNAGIVPNVRQSAGEMPTLISLVAAGMGVAILPTSAVKHNVAAVTACTIVDPIPLSEIGLALSKESDSAIAKNFGALARKLFTP